MEKVWVTIVYVGGALLINHIMGIGTFLIAVLTLGGLAVAYLLLEGWVNGR